MNGIRGQYSLAALLVVVTAVCLLLGVFRTVPVPEFRAVDSIIWWGAAMVLSITGGSFLIFRWLNQ